MVTTQHELLPTFEPSANDLIELALSQPLDRKIDVAVKTLQMYEAQALRLSPDGYWLAYSGGKDSDVILELAKMAGVKYRPVYNVTTIDAPELVRYIKREHSEVEFQRAEHSLLHALVNDPLAGGPPTRLARWCCRIYKEQGGAGTVKMVGVRVEESTRRRGLWKTCQPHRAKTGGAIVCPIVYWTEADVWCFHALRGIPHCELYDEGFKRLGCIGCPLAGPTQQRRTFDRWPKYEAAWRRAFDRLWDKWHGVPTRKGKRRWFEDFGSAQGLWDWWISGKAAEGDDGGCQMNLFEY